MFVAQTSAPSTDPAEPRLCEPIPFRRPSAARGREIMSGELGELSLAAILQLVLYEAVSGWLTIPDDGQITLQRGHVIDARCGRLAGVEALRELLFLEGGRFVLTRGEPPPGLPIDNVTFATVDAYRLRDEWSRLRDVVLRPIAGAAWRPTGGHLDDVHAELDGRRTLAEIVQARGGGVTLLLDAIVDALALGLLEKVAVAGEARVAAEVTIDPDLGFFDLVDRGRDHLRAGDLDAAEAILRRALALRPDDRVVQQNLTALALRRRIP